MVYDLSTAVNEVFRPPLLFHFFQFLHLGLLPIALCIAMFPSWVHIYMWCYVFLMICPHYLYKISHFALYYFSYLEIYFVCYTCFSLQALVWSIVFKQMFALELRWVSSRQHIVGPCFSIHPATLCLLTGEFIPLTFRMMIDIQGLTRAILSFVLWLLHTSIVSPPCDFVCYFSLAVFCDFFLLFFSYHVLYLSSFLFCC